MTVGYDLDGVINGALPPPDCELIVSGRTWAEYDERARQLAAMVPVYVRGAGKYGDRHAAGGFKAIMMTVLGVDVFHEDDPVQAAIIARRVPGTTVILHCASCHAANRLGSWRRERQALVCPDCEARLGAH